MDLHANLSFPLCRWSLDSTPESNLSAFLVWEEADSQLLICTQNLRQSAQNSHVNPIFSLKLIGRPIARLSYGYVSESNTQTSCVRVRLKLRSTAVVDGGTGNEHKPTVNVINVVICAQPDCWNPNSFKSFLDLIKLASACTESRLFKGEDGTKCGQGHPCPCMHASNTPSVYHGVPASVLSANLGLLEPRCKLNDEIINFGIRCIVDSSEHSLKMLALSTFFYETLESSAKTKLDRWKIWRSWSPKVSPYVIVPIHDHPDHWFLVCAKLNRKRNQGLTIYVWICNSLPQLRGKAAVETAQTIGKYLVQKAADVMGMDMQPDDGAVNVCVATVPEQDKDNTYDCGIHVLMNALTVAADPKEGQKQSLNAKYWLRWDSDGTRASLKEYISKLLKQQQH